MSSLIVGRSGYALVEAECYFSLFFKTQKTTGWGSVYSWV